ncbi:MAG: hypothetical protein IKX54_03985 [Lachnospiraceae bacterium]|nr:hypothetical protein [Lachnospiraceae bacterium]
MKRTGKKLLLLATVIAMLFAFSACGKEKESDPDSTDITATPGQPDNPGGPDVKEPISLPVELNLPEGAAVREEKGVFFVDTTDYLLCVFSTDTVQNGAIFDESDVFALISSGAKASLANEVLKLKEFSVSGSGTKFYDNINGMRGYLVPMSHLTYEDAAGSKTEGAGFVVIYGKPNDVGVYIVEGISKANGGGSLESGSGKAALDIAMSLIPKETEPKYVVWENAMPDGTEVRFAYKNGSVLKVVTDGDDLLLPFNEEGTTGIMIRHNKNRADQTAKNLLQGLIDSLKDDGTTFGEIVTVQGRMEYRKVIMTYTENDQKMKEVLCLASDETGSCWLLDLYGTEEEVNSKEDELQALMWSLEEE